MEWRVGFNPWCFRPCAAKWFQIPLDPSVEPVCSFTPPSPDVCFFHGDGIDNLQYRGEGAFIMEKLDPWGRQFLLHSTWGFCGFAASPLFSDVPLQFHFGSGSGVVDLLIWPSVSEPRFNVSVSCAPNEKGMLLVREDSCEWLPWSVALGLCPSQDEEFVDRLLQNGLRRVQRRKAWTSNQSRCLVWHSIGKLFLLPREISDLIADFTLVEQPRSEAFCAMCYRFIYAPDLASGECAACGRTYCTKTDCFEKSHVHLANMCFP